MHVVPLGRNPVDGSTPLKGRQPELVNYQSPRSDARRTCSSRGTATLHHRRTPANPSPRTRRTGGAEKGVQNRRFWRVFGYFCRAAKVPEESGGEEPPGQRKETTPPMPRTDILRSRGVAGRRKVRLPGREAPLRSRAPFRRRRGTPAPPRTRPPRRGCRRD